jgi:hypothetical protein
MPLVAKGGLLERNSVAHATLAKALDNDGRSASAVAHLTPLVAQGGLLERDPVAHNTLAKALDNDDRSASAVAHLMPLVAKGGLLERNSVARNTLAKALDNDGRSASAVAHLMPLVAKGGLLERNPVAHATLAKALDNDGRSASAVAHLMPLVAKGGLLERDPVALTIAAVAATKSNQPDVALQVLRQIPGTPSRPEHLLTYLVAKAHFIAGRHGTSKTLMHPVIGKHKDNAFAVLYLACHNDDAEHIGVFKMALGKQFANLWKKSRQLQSDISVIDEDERSLLRANSIWELGAVPVNRQALSALGLLPEGRDAPRRGPAGLTGLKQTSSPS